MKGKKQKISALFLTAVLLFAGCGSEPKQSADKTDSMTGSEEATVDTEAGAEVAVDTEAVAETAEETADAVATEVVTEETDTANITEAADTAALADGKVSSDALAFVYDMKTGWNLGNTFDAVDYNGLHDELLYESCWCGVKTTKEMIDTLKKAGFETIRIPVSWHNHLTDEQYTISEEWISRVQEVVDYAIENDMYVILNIHHDCSTNYYYPSSEYLEQSKQYITSIWSQLAERFKEYDEHLIMESINEPRLVGDANEWWLDIQKENCKDSVLCINELNQCFVDVVRASGGKNASRYLMVPGYCASYIGATNEYFVLPQDIAENENKILVSVHAYIPYAFALQAVGESGSTDKFDSNSLSSTGEIDSMMDKLNEMYIQKGIGVVIGEYGARDKGGNTQARAEFTAYYIKAARQRKITCCIWDNNAFSGSGEVFGLLNRKTLEFAYPEILESIMKNCE